MCTSITVTRRCGPFSYRCCHIDALASKISKTIGVLNSLKHILSINILRIIYNSLIVCHLNYGVLVWGTQSNLNNKMIKLQKGQLVL